MAVCDVFTPECLNDLFPQQRTDDFFDALFGDAEEGGAAGGAVLLAELLAVKGYFD